MPSQQEKENMRESLLPDALSRCRADLTALIAEVFWRVEMGDFAGATGGGRLLIECLSVPFYCENMPAFDDKKYGVAMAADYYLLNRVCLERTNHTPFDDKASFGLLKKYLGDLINANDTKQTGGHAARTFNSAHHYMSLEVIVNSSWRERRRLDDISEFFVKLTESIHKAEMAINLCGLTDHAKVLKDMRSVYDITIKTYSKESQEAREHFGRALYSMVADGSIKNGVYRDVLTDWEKLRARGKYVVVIKKAKPTWLSIVATGAVAIAITFSLFVFWDSGRVLTTGHRYIEFGYRAAVDDVVLCLLLACALAVWSFLFVKVRGRREA